MQSWGYNELINHCTSLTYDLTPPGYQIGLTEGYAVTLTAIDSTGFESRHCSKYYISRKNRHSKQIEHTTYISWPKFGLICDCNNHLILSTDFSIGPFPDVGQLIQTCNGLATNVTIDCLVADAGYDSAGNHQYLRTHHVESIIPASHGRPTDKLPTDQYRFLMVTAFDEQTYGQRWQVETVMSMLKRNLGTALTARSDDRRNQ